MANKTLTATVRLNTTNAERAISRLTNRVNALNNQLNNVGTRNTGVTRQLQNANAQTNRVVNATRRWGAALSSNRNILGGIGTKLKGIASTYLGIMGMKAITGVSDTITSAQNKLNYVTAQQTGDTEGDTYSQATLDQTSKYMDKMYVSAQKVRMSYTDMMSNVSKSMTLAGKSFQGSTDNAIRFQEIMAEAYAVGGASAQEMSSSMYQMIQALGAGTLAGDELRSVREGAPLAYQAIEEFAQGIYNTTDSLKDMASEGMITSDIVVAAIMGAGDRMDKAFEKTEMTFGQAWNKIKNMALYAFKPISNMFNKMLNDFSENGGFEKLEKVFLNLSKAVQITAQIIVNTISWIADNWGWLKYVIIFALTAIGAYFIYVKSQAIISAIATAIAWATANASLLLTILVIAAIVTALIWLADQCSSVGEFIERVAMIVANAIIAILLIVAAVYLVTGTLMMSVPMLIMLIVIGVIAVLLAVFLKFTGEICGGVSGIVSWIGAACSNIGRWFSNTWHETAAGFWDLCATMMDGLSWLEPAFDAIAKLFGADGFSISASVESMIEKRDAHLNKVKDYKDLGEAWDTGYSNGYEWGTNLKSKLYSSDGSSLLDKMGGALGLDLLSGFPDANDPSNLVNGSYQIPDDLTSNVEDIKDNTNSSKEDFEMMRKLADMEWRNEFTTAEIKVDMTNYNTMNSEQDITGLVSLLSDKLTEEMASMANGVHY